MEDTLIIGELSLDGSIRHVKSLLLVSALAGREGYETIIVPEVDALKTALVPDISVITEHTLHDLYGHLTGLQPLELAQSPAHDPEEVMVETDYSEMKRQEHVKRSLEVAATGRQNLFMSCIKSHCIQ